MIPLVVPNLAGNEALYLQECLETNFVSTVGPFVDRFERMVAKSVGSRFAVATSAGTTGLHAALIALGVGRDELVILPSFTFIASANAVAHCGATPWFLDVDRESWTLDPDGLARALETKTELYDGRRVHCASRRRVAAIMPVYTLGLPADMDRIMDLARHFGLPVVADGAAAIGASYRGRTAGALGADLTVFSFNGNKTVTAGGGGAVVGDDESSCRRVRHLTTTARNGPGYDHDMVGFNYRMTNLQAAVGCAQVERLTKLVEAKRRISRAYRQALEDLGGVGWFPQPGWAQSSCWLSGLTIVKPSVSEMIASLRERGIDARPFWKPIHLQRPYRDAPAEPTPVSDDVWPTVLTLPCSTHLTESDQRRVIEAVRRGVLE